MRRRESELTMEVKRRVGKARERSVLGLLRLALWPPTTFPRLDMVIEVCLDD